MGKQYKRKQYYIYYPNNFGNEYEVYSVSNDDEKKKINEWIDEIDWYKSDLHRITVKELRAKMSSLRIEHELIGTIVDGPLSFDEIPSVTEYCEYCDRLDDYYD